MLARTYLQREPKESVHVNIRDKRWEIKLTCFRDKEVTISVHSHGGGSDVCGDVEIRDPKVLP